MSELKAVLAAAVVVLATGHALQAATVSDSVSLVPSFASASTIGGASLNVIPTYTSGNTLYVYSSGQPGIYTINYDLNSSFATGGFSSLAFGINSSAGITLPASGPYYLPDTTNTWYTGTTSGGTQVTLNNDFSSGTPLQDIVASVGNPTDPLNPFNHFVGGIRLQWDGKTSATISLNDTLGDGVNGQISYTTDVNGVASSNQLAADPWTVQFVPVIPGDANYDGVVDGTDLGILATNFNKTGLGWTSGNFNGDAAIDGTDLGILATYFNHKFNPQSSSQVASFSALQGAITNVPEPSTISALAIGCMAFLYRRRP